MRVKTIKNGYKNYEGILVSCERVCSCINTDALYNVTLELKDGEEVTVRYCNGIQILEDTQ